MPHNRLLVIDDEPDVAATVGRVARRAGFDTIVTTDGADFLQRWESWRPTVMVLDLAMPEIGGREILSELSRKGCQTRILIVSGHEPAVLEGVMGFGRDLGLSMVGILPKPLRLDKLRQFLRNIYDEALVISPEDTRLAISRNEFFLEYQPKISLDSLRIIGVEALARWNHPDRGLVSPDAFMPILESSGVMDAFTPHVIGMVAAQMRVWADAGIDLGVAVNVSGGCVARLPIDDIILRQCAERRIDPARLTVEITETAAMGDVGHAVGCMRRLKAMGVRISIDDFGTGYSSLVQLHRLPFSELKIDKSFVIGCDVDRESRVIVGTIVNLAHNLGLDVVAEGVETASVRDYLSGAGCDIAQGYLFSRPLPAARLPEWIAAASAPSAGDAAGR